MKNLRRLARRRSSRSEHGLFVIDGPLLVREAFEAGVSLETVYFESEIFDRADEGVLISEVEARGVAAREVAPGSLAKVLDLGSPQGVVAVAHQGSVPLEEVLRAAADRSRPVLVAAGIADPGNAGTIVRTAEGAGCAGVVFTEGSVDLFNPKVVRASAGSMFRVPVADRVSEGDLVDRCSVAGIPLVATVARGGEVPERADLSGALAVMVGSESHGISDALAGAAEIQVTIPMDGQVESLNAGVSAAVLAFEAARQRRRL